MSEGGEENGGGEVGVCDRHKWWRIWQDTLPGGQSLQQREESNETTHVRTGELCTGCWRNSVADPEPVEPKLF